MAFFCFLFKSQNLSDGHVEIPGFQKILCMKYILVLFNKAPRKLHMMADFMGQVGWATVPRYVVKSDSGCFRERFGVRFIFKFVSFELSRVTFQSIVIIQLLSRPILWDSTDCSTPGFPVLHYPPKFVQTHVHWVGDAIQPSHPLLPSSPPAFNLSQHQLQLQYLSFQWIFRTDFL